MSDLNTLLSAKRVAYKRARLQFVVGLLLVVMSPLLLILMPLISHEYAWEPLLIPAVVGGAQAIINYSLMKSYDT